MNYKYFMDIHKDSCEFGWVYKGKQIDDKILIINEIGLDQFTLDEDDLITYVEITEAEYNKRIIKG